MRKTIYKRQQKKTELFVMALNRRKTNHTKKPYEKRGFAIELRTVENRNPVRFFSVGSLLSTAYEF